MKSARTLLGSLAVTLIVLILAAPSANYLVAQESTPAATEEPTLAPSPTPEPTATAFTMQDLDFTLIGQADFLLENDGQVSASAATITLPPGTASLPFVVNDPTVVMVQTGEVFVTADNAAISYVDTSAVVGIYPSAGTPGPVETFEVTKGQQLVLMPGATCLIRNDSKSPATVLILSIAS